MLLVASKIVFCLIIVSIISGIIGYLIAKVKYQQKTIKSDINPILRKPGNIYNKPFILGQPRPAGKDDLKLIQGIDSDLENKLNTLGIFHIEQISIWNQKNIEWIDEYFSLDNKVSEERWVEQANDMIKR